MKNNIFANLIGKFWGLLSNFLFIPLYIHILGFDNYSIISFTLILIAIMAILDVGISASLTREIASSENSNKDKVSIFNTLETLYIFITFISIGFLFFLSPYIASNWINVSHLESGYLSNLLKIVAFGIGFEILLRFYFAGFIGLDRQVLSNQYRVLWGVFRNALVIIPIYYIKSLLIFFLWQTLITFLFLIFVKFHLHALLYTNKNEYHFLKFDKSIIMKIWKFAGSIFLISLIAVLNTQMDKLALSKLLSIEVLGLYMLAFSLSNVINIVGTSISISFLPKLTEYFTDKKNVNDRISMVKQALIVNSVFIISISTILSVFSQQIIYAWTNNSTLSINAGLLLPYIVIGSAFLSLQGVFFNVAIANGFMRYNNIIGIISLFFTLPGYWFFTHMFGSLGAAITFSITQFSIFIIYSYLINKKFIKMNIYKYYFNKILLPFVLSLIVSIIFLNFIFFMNNRFLIVINLLFISMIIFAINSCILGLKKFFFKSKDNIF